VRELAVWWAREDGGDGRRRAGAGRRRVAVDGRRGISARGS